MTRSLPVGFALLDNAALGLTGDAIATVQLPSGAIPSSPGGLLDPWDHVQSAMGLATAGRWAEAEAAYDWSQRAQRDDGSWAAGYRCGREDEVVHHHVDANFCAYLATGVWHHWLTTGDAAFVERLWPAVVAGIEATLRHRRRDGVVAWASASSGMEHDALLTGNASIQLSVRCAVALGELLDEPHPEWAVAAERIRHAVHVHPDAFLRKGTHAMDWYYPVLSGAVPGEECSSWLDRRWTDFVVPDLGVRCVSDHPWVTGGETAELALALARASRDADARAVLGSMQHLRDDDGAYWTGLVYSDGKRWPVERTTWTAATVLLATDCLSGDTPAAALFRGGLALRGPESGDPFGREEEDMCPCLLAS